MSKGKDALNIEEIYSLYSEFQAVLSKYVRPRPKRMSHYTNLSGLLGIVESKSFWLSDLGYVNDSEELTHGFSVINKIFDDRIKGKNLFNNLINSNLRACIVLATNKYKVYSMSFCENGDLLSQWRGYAEGGVSIEFDLEDLELQSLEGSIDSIMYDDNKKEPAIYDLLLTMGSKIHDILRDGYNFSSPDVSRVFVSSILGLAATLKNQNFQEETEVRLFNTFYGNCPNLRHRVSNGVIMPYIEHEVDLKTAMKKIVVGPSRREDLVIKGIGSLLRSYNLDHVSLEMSRIPFRRI